MFIHLLIVLTGFDKQFSCSLCLGSSCLLFSHAESHMLTKEVVGPGGCSGSYPVKLQNQSGDSQLRKTTTLTFYSTKGGRRTSWKEPLPRLKACHFQHWGRKCILIISFVFSLFFIISLLVILSHSTVCCTWSQGQRKGQQACYLKQTTESPNSLLIYNTKEKYAFHNMNTLHTNSY